MSLVNTADDNLNERAMKGWNDWLAAWIHAVHKAWTDKSFKSHLLSDARAALKHIGYEVPAILEIEVVEVTNRQHDMLPVSNHSPYVFTPGIDLPKQRLVIGLLPPPANLGDGLITLADHAGLPHAQCFCACS
jgi:ribosomally synthesized peptide (two-chain TOMM family)